MYSPDRYLEIQSNQQIADGQGYPYMSKDKKGPIFGHVKVENESCHYLSHFFPFDAPQSNTSSLFGIHWLLIH